MTKRLCDNCGKEIAPRSGWRVTRQGTAGFLFMLRANLTRHATEENEHHVCNDRCAGKFLALMTKPNAKSDKETSSQGDQ